MKEIKSTIIFGKGAYGITKLKRTKLTIFKSSLWLSWWNFRIWLANKGLFVKKIYIEE